MSDFTLQTLISDIRRHLPGIAFALLLSRESEGWKAIDRQFYEKIEPEPPIPEDAVLDYAARAARPTYLPQGDEGSEFCLIDVRATLYLPMDGGRKLLYIAGKSADAFSHGDVEAAWRTLGRPPAP